MDRFRPPNPVEVAIAAFTTIVGTAPYWIEGFFSVRLPLWTVAAAIVLALAAYLLLTSIRRRALDRRRRDEERHQQILSSIDRLAQRLHSD